MNAVQHIKNSINRDSIIRVLEKYNANKITDLGGTIRCTCPLHGGDNPTAFTWDYENGLWFCFTGDCGGGDIFDFTANIFDLSIEHDFKVIVQKTAEILDLDISNLELGERASQHVKETREWVEFISRKQRIVNPFYDITKLGECYPINSYRNFSKELIESFGAKYNKALNRIMIPLYNDNGETVGATLRKIDETEVSKWIHRPKHINTRELLYNVHKVEGEYVLITEGCFDVWNAKRIGIDFAVASFGAHIADEQVNIIIKRFTDVLLAFDSDKAGRNATRKAIEKLKYTTNLLVLDLGEIHDVGDIPDKETYIGLPKLKWYEWIEKYGEKEGL